MNIWRELFRAKVRVLRVRPGDVVVLECSRPLTFAQAEELKAHWNDRFPDLPAAVLSDDIKLGGVVRPPEWA